MSASQLGETDPLCSELTGRRKPSLVCTSAVQDLSALGINTPRNPGTASENCFIWCVGGAGWYSCPREVARVSGGKVVWPCTIGQSRGVGRCFDYIGRGCRVGVVVTL